MIAVDHTFILYVPMVSITFPIY